MPQAKQYSQQQIIQHTSHSSSSAATIANPQHHLHQQAHHVQHINLAASSLHHQAHHHNSQQQPAQTAHMIQVAEEFLEQAANNHNTGSMMISTTGEVINQQQIYKIVSTDGTTGNMIIDATNQSANSTTTTSKVLLSNLTVLSKQQPNSQAQIINNNQQPQTVGQTINFVNAKNFYTASTAGANIVSGSKQQKFAVATGNGGNYKGSTIKQTSSVNSQYLQQPNAIGHQKINMTAGTRNVQMLTTTRVQNTASNNTTSNVTSNTNSITVISNNSAPAQTMVLQQPQKYIANSTTSSSKVSTPTLGSSGGNVIKKTTAAGTLKINNSHNSSASTKVMNNQQTTPGVKTFITQSPNLQQQAQQNMNQLTLQHHSTKSGSKSKFVKQYNNAILNSAGAVAIATLPHQQSNNQNNLQIQQHHQPLQTQTTYINHHKNSGGSTKINKINSKYAQSVNMAAQLPPGTQLHHKSIIQSQQQQQFQSTNSNSNIKFVNAQGTVIQQQPLQQQQQQQQQLLAPQKVNNKHHHILHQQQYQNLQNFDSVDGNNLFHQVNVNQSAAGVTTSLSSGSTSLTLATTTGGSSLLTDDIMMVNGTQMTDELSARILQSMSQKSFSNQRHQQQHHVFQTKTTTAAAVSTSINFNNSSSNNNNNMLPPPTCTTQNTIVQTNNNSSILLSPREFTLFPSAASNPTNQQSQQQHLSSHIHYNNSATPTATASSNITAGSFSSSNYITVTNNNNITSTTPHTSGISTANGVLCSNTISSGSANTIRQAQSAPNSRSQSMERKLHESSMSRKSSEYYKINNNSNHNSLRGSGHHNNIASAVSSVAQTSVSVGVATANISASVSNLTGGASSTSTLATSLSMPRPPSLPPAALIMEPQAQVIHLQATKTLPGTNNSSNDDDDDIIGEEIRPAPVDTEDIRLRILHTVLFDHTYVHPMPLELPTTFAVQLPPTSNSISAVSTATTTSGITLATGHNQQWSLGGIGAITAAGSGGIQQNYTLYGSQLSRLHQDIDSYSALNTNSGLTVGDIDPGEETETAPEAELEDDSITRCICDLTHDDGYMICCDKCCAWQHVDCMGIDRQNIPDEYLCELCQPRIVDKARARSLQLMKRREQQQQLMLTTQTQASVSAGIMGAAGSANGGSTSGIGNLLPNDVLGAQHRLATSSGAGYSITGNMAVDSNALQILATGGSNLKKSKMLKKVKDGVSGKRTKKAEKLAAATVGLTANSKPGRKETKKNTKRKKTGANDSNCSTVGMTAAEKHAANLRQWIENYEFAVTNHYSPELRARLHAISKQPSLLQSILNTENPILKEFSNGSLENRATTVPHAGGKILISNLDIVPNSPICELRGKYMLTTQYKTQNTSMNMNSPPPNNYHLASYKAHKTPGPFIFFYQLPGTELGASSQIVPQMTTTTTLNPDGTYTTTTTTSPAQQSPPTFLKGPEICVDTRTYGNEARFVRRSCRPNAELQHLFEKGTIHLFIVALTDIRASTEITVRHEPHDLLAVDNKKSSTMVIQATSTPCACGLTKDCIFGPPLPQLPLAAKSNAGRKSLAHTGGFSGNAANLTGKQRKANQQNFNRNRSISSSASGDSNMGITALANTTAIGLNSPNNVIKMTASNKISSSNTLMPLTASCNSNLSNASSSSSALTTVMHDSGVCTSSSSPSVSIPSPTQHMHSPIQQQHQVLQQQGAQQLLHNTKMRPTVQLLPQQQQQQIMQSLPTPLVLLSPNISPQQQQHSQKQSVLQQPAMIIQQQQTFNVIAQSTTSLNLAQDGNNAIPTERKQPQTLLCALEQPMAEQLTNTQTQHHSIQQHIVLQEKHHQAETQSSQHSVSILAVSSGLLESASPEATIAAVALQSLNALHSPNTTLAAPSSTCENVEEQLQSPKIAQQQFAIDSAERIAEQQRPTSDQLIQTSENNKASTSSTSPAQQQSPQQQYKSPQKSYHSQNSSTQSGRKTPGKHGRTTSFSEENDHQSEDNSLTSTPTSSTPKEKPKLSREDRKMEAILRAIEKMERNQQKQKQTKRQNSGSNNTTPTSPNKTFESLENSGGTKRSNNQAGTAGRSKKKRKAGSKGGQGSANSNQRKRRQSRMNSQESIEECNQQDHDAITSESDGCTAIQSPPVQTIASPRQPQFSTCASLSATGSITADISIETPNNVDQAAGLLMAFANPSISPDKNNSSVKVDEDHMQKSPQTTSQYIMPSIEVATSPPTPPSQVSSACLLIEAAVGPLESNVDDNNEEINNSEFKYPMQAKTKKHLMNNWLHQAEDNSPDNIGSSTLPEQTSQPMETPATSVVSSSVNGVSVVSGGLDSLLQAAMSDIKQSQSDQEQPQNLSIAAQKVEEFIQQTEASACNVQEQPQSNHSFEYKQHKEQLTTYVPLPTPAVDLTLKTPLTIGANLSSADTTYNRNMHLPLQVSTCSNNSSVKKRWLRQAISEETHEEFQHASSMAPSPNSTINAFPSSQVQPTSTFSPAAVCNYIPNGFTTPLKKRRLLLTDKDEFEENAMQNCGDSCTNTTPSPPLAVTIQQQQPQFDMQFNTIDQHEHVLHEIKSETAQDLSTRSMHEDAEVDVEKLEINRTQLIQTEEDVHKSQLQQELKGSKVEKDQDRDVDVTTSTTEHAPILQDQVKMTFKHENDVATAEEKKEYLKSCTQQTEQFNDQEDDVDILRSPSPGREMIKAEDNLVKIEPEDTTGMEDVKIDVEREESMAADDVVVSQHKEKGMDRNPVTYKEDQQNNLQCISSNVEIEKKIKIDLAKENNAAEKNQGDHKDIEEVVVFKSESPSDITKQADDESHAEIEEPKSKRIKLEKSEEKKDTYSVDEMSIKPEISSTTKERLKQEVVLYSTSKQEEKFLKTEFKRNENHPTIYESAEVSSSVSSTLSAVKSVAADTTFNDVEPATPPLPCTTKIMGETPAPIQRNKSLSDDDIQARLHSFHKENILFLQSRNKKTKSSSSLISNANSSSSANCLVNNNDHNKYRSSSSSSNNQHHHNHHHHHHHYHEGKEKSEKSGLKHQKSSSSTVNVTTKKRKLHKRERTTSSCSLNSNKISTNPQIPPSTSTNKNVINSSSILSGSSKKLKSLKKSSSGSSTSSNTSISSYSNSILAAQISYPTSSSAVVTTTSISSEKEKAVDRDNKQQKQKTTSVLSSSSNVSSGNSHVTHTTPYLTSKKRQLNFELELTKDMHLLNSANSCGSKHKKDTSRLMSDDQIHVSTKKTRKDSNLTQKEEVRNGTNRNSKIEKQQDKKLSNTNVGCSNSSAFSQRTITPASSTPNTPISSNTTTEEPKLISTILSQPSQSSQTPATIVREHQTLSHFDNVVVSTNSSLVGHQQPPQPALTTMQSQAPSVLPQNIPNLVNIPSYIPSVHSNHNSQLQQIPVSVAQAPAKSASSNLSTQSLNATSHLPFYNTIYGKLLDNSTPPPSLPTTMTASTTTTTLSSPVTSTSVSTSGGVLLEYLDTKLKSYNTLGGYVSHSALFGLNNASVIKDPPASSAVVSSSTVSVESATAQVKDSSSEMTVSLLSTLTVTGSSCSGNSSSTAIPLKIHTKTASHDPRLNPHLTAPEPPPQPKRKLSINEYRKRMQQSSSNDPIGGSGNCTTTLTTPPISLEQSSLLGPITMSLANKCTLNSPDRLTQSVDSQIQKEIMSTTSAVTSSSSSDSLNSSNSSTSLNDSLLKSSSFVEEDSTKGQFNAAPTLLEKQQESLCARLKSLKEKQSLGSSFCISGGNRSRFSSFSESIASSDFGLRKDDDEMDIIRNRNLSISSSSIGAGDLLDNCLEEISSTSTSMSSSREPSPERCYTTHHKILTASTTTSTTNTSATNHSNNGPTTKHYQQPPHHQQHNINCDKNELTSLERKKSLDIA